MKGEMRMWYIIVALVFEILNVATLIWTKFFQKEPLDEVDTFIVEEIYGGKLWRVVLWAIIRIVAWPASIAYTIYVILKWKEA